MGLFDGIQDAELFERGRYMPPGFKGIVEVRRTLAKESVRSGVGFIVELEVVSVESPGDEGHELSPVREGDKRTWWQGMKDKTVAFPALKAWAAACAGYHTNQKEEIERDVSPHLGDTLTHATDNPADNDFVECRLMLTTYHKTTKNDRDFTVYDWSPAGE